ncbi:MAG TPA: hypothetical protein DD733_08910, partial [Clostridiales bacterium]|nr:hypothetical protein [Clostridiales bacterium]
GIKQENFDCLSRVQDVLKKLGVISLEKNKTEKIEDFFNKIKDCGNSDYILAQVTPDFSKTVLYSRALRVDHYILVKTEGDVFKIQNDIPERAVTLDKQQFSDVFVGEYFKMTVLRGIGYKDVCNLWTSRRHKPEEQEAFDLRRSDLEGIEELGIKLRNMVGVCKILLRRMAEYYGIYINTDFIWKTVSITDKLYATLEYHNLRKNVPVEKYYMLAYDFNNIYTDILKQLQIYLYNKVDIRND